jgi:hypothetical protein
MSKGRAVTRPFFFESLLAVIPTGRTFQVEFQQALVDEVSRRVCLVLDSLSVVKVTFYLRRVWSLASPRKIEIRRENHKCSIVSNSNSYCMERS